MAKSPTNIQDAEITFTITVDGTKISGVNQVLSLTVDHKLNKISYAEVVIVDGDPSSGDFPISEGETFMPGNKIEINAGYDEDETLIFKGVIVKQSIRSSPDGSQLVIYCKHQVIEMTWNRTEAEFSKKTDHDIISQIFSAYGISATVASTSLVHEGMIQKMATDWDFILSRSDFYGFVIAMDGDKLTVDKPKTSTSKLLLTYGTDIISFNAELDAQKQLPDVSMTSWDIKNLTGLTVKGQEPEVAFNGNVNGKKLSSKINQKSLELITATPLASDELTEWSNGYILKMRMMAMKGEVSFVGNAEPKTGGFVTLAGLGDRYNGDAFVSGVSHVIADGEWTTTVNFGLEPINFPEVQTFSNPPASNLLPAIYGLQFGTVKQLSKDPESIYRVLVNTPVLSGKEQTGFWARMANYYATEQAGFVFMPEIGDEVILGFIDGDPRFPVILGSLYSSKKASPFPANDDKNFIKAITTKAKLNITFDDEKKVITIKTPGGNKITISDDQKSIELVDQNSNKVSMTDAGIKLDSPKDIVLKATGNITLNATGKIGITAQQDVEVAGLNIKNTAQMGFSAKGNATAELQASGQTTVKGAIVMIN